MSNESAIGYETSVLGDYTLGAVIRRSPSSTVYETEFRGPDGETRPAVIKVRELDAAAAAAAVRRRRSAMKLEHPHLQQLYAAGTSCTNGATTAWVVMERADESLAGVLAERALSEDEVTQMLGPAVAALAYLHKSGYAHAALKPSNVLAAGDRLKLSCDNAIRISDDLVPGADIRTEDIQALGALITESLTERGPNGVIRHPAGRFEEILRHCAEPDPAKRWTAEQIAAHLEGKEAAKEVVASEPQPEVVPVVTALAEEVPAAPTSSRGFPKWILAGLAVVILAVLLFASLRTGKDKSTPAPPAPAPVVASVAPPIIQQEPAPAKPKPFAETPRATPSPANRKADGWSVIVAAYGSHDAAEKRMNSLAKRWPAFHLNVSEHNPERASWIITVGDNLSEDEAESLRARTVSSGLAPDAYIKRIK